MRKLLKAALVAASLTAVGAAHAGVSDAFSFAIPTVTAVSDRVTYATTTPELVTYVGFDVGSGGRLITNDSGATVNKFVLKFTASVVTPSDGAVTSELLTLLPAQSSIPASCTYPVDSFGKTVPSNSVTITCSVDQMKNGDWFPAFTVFYLAPQAASAVTTACAGSVTTTAALANCNGVRTTVDLQYAEGMNDQPASPVNNSTQTTSDKLVALGTTNPSFVKSALPKNFASGSKIFTGNGVPMVGAPDEFKEFTESVALQPFTTNARYGQATIKVQSDDTNDGQCTNLGNFRNCPLYETSLIDPVTLTPLTFFPALQFTYRIDASQLKRPPAQILNNTLIYYSANGLDYALVLDICGAPGVVPGKVCIDMSPGFAPKCYKNLPKVNGLPNPLEGDCEWNLLKDSNGFVKFN
jgi:hypothetical protein